MPLAKRILIALLVYVGIVVAFESMIGFFQPADTSTMVIATTDEGGTTHDRVVARLESNDTLYVAANHWPRAWYRNALALPNIEVALDEEGLDKKPYVAVPITGAEYDRVNAEHGLPLLFRFVTGFPPRHLVRLDPR